LRAKLSEIMESIQGEGLLVGSRQIFLRFAGCNIRCSYCDTPESFTSDRCRFSPHPGTNLGAEEIENPLSIDQIIELISAYGSKWISLTGGEPLLWAKFISQLAPQLKSKGYQILLETNGILHQQLDSCLPYIDMISMDIKTGTATGHDYMDDHALFLAKALAKTVYVKIVIDARTTLSEIDATTALIKSLDVNIPLILQPVTPRINSVAPTIERLLQIQNICLSSLSDVRVVPQIHKTLEVI